MNRRFSNRRIPALILSGLGAGALFAATAGQPEDTSADADPAVVDRYLAQLSQTVPPPVATKLARRNEAPADPLLQKDVAKADRAEPVVGAAFSVVR